MLTLATHWRLFHAIDFRAFSPIIIIFLIICKPWTITWYPLYQQAHRLLLAFQSPGSNGQKERTLCWTCEIWNRCSTGEIYSTTIWKYCSGRHSGIAFQKIQKENVPYFSNIVYYTFLKLGWKHSNPNIVWIYLAFFFKPFGGGERSSEKWKSVFNCTIVLF